MIARAVFKYVEHELYNYEATKRDIEELRYDIIEGTPIKEAMGSSAGYTGDSTGRKAATLLTNKSIAKMTRTVIAIERVLARANEDHRQLFELKYRQCLSWQQVCVEIPTSERSYFRLRRELVALVANELGLAESWQD